MPKDNQQPAPHQPLVPANEDNQQDQTIHVRNPFTGEETEITQEQLDSVQKGIEAQTERD